MIIVQTNCDTKAEAQDIAKALLHAKLALVTHISQVSSMYLWKGNIIEGKEFVLKIRTLKERLSEVMGMIKEMHSYEVPPVYAVMVSDISEEYLNLAKREIKRE